MAASEETWAEIERLYCETKDAIKSIAERFDMDRSTIYRRAAAWNWPPRYGRSPASAARSRAAARARRRRGLTLTERLVQLAERNLDLLEDQMDSKDGVLTPADGERVTRAFGSVTRSIDKLKELSSSHERNAADASGAADITGSDVERRRLEIAERLERIQQRREAAERSA